MSDIDPGRAAKWYAEAQSRLAELTTIREYVAEQLDSAERCVIDEQRHIDVKLAALAKAGWTPEGTPSVAERVRQACPHGPDDPCTCNGCSACDGHEIGCTCDIDWDALAELRLDRAI